MQFGNAAKTSDGAASFADRKGRPARMIGFRSTLLEDDLDSLKRMKTMRCNLNVVSRKVADAKGKVNSLADWLRCYTFESYALIWHKVDQTLVAVHCCLRDLNDREALKLQHSVFAALCNAASGVQMLIVGAPKKWRKS